MILIHTSHTHTQVRNSRHYKSHQNAQYPWTGVRVIGDVDLNATYIPIRRYNNILR